jgi:hypothetical protein
MGFDRETSRGSIHSSREAGYFWRTQGRQKGKLSSSCPSTSSLTNTSSLVCLCIQPAGAVPRRPAIDSACKSDRQPLSAGHQRSETTGIGRAELYLSEFRPEETEERHVQSIRRVGGCLADNPASAKVHRQTHMSVESATRQGYVEAAEDCYLNSDSYFVPLSIGWKTARKVTNCQKDMSAKSAGVLM